MFSGLKNFTSKNLLGHLTIILLLRFAYFKVVEIIVNSELEK